MKVQFSVTIFFLFIANFSLCEEFKSSDFENIICLKGKCIGVRDLGEQIEIETYDRQSNSSENLKYPFYSKKEKSLFQRKGGRFISAKVWGDCIYFFFRFESDKNKKWEIFSKVYEINTGQFHSDAKLLFVQNQLRSGELEFYDIHVFQNEKYLFFGANNNDGGNVLRMRYEVLFFDKNLNSIDSLKTDYKFGAQIFPAEYHDNLEGDFAILLRQKKNLIKRHLREYFYFDTEEIYTLYTWKENLKNNLSVKFESSSAFVKLMSPFILSNGDVGVVGTYRNVVPENYKTQGVHGVEYYLFKGDQLELERTNRVRIEDLSEGQLINDWKKTHEHEFSNRDQNETLKSRYEPEFEESVGAMVSTAHDLLPAHFDYLNGKLIGCFRVGDIIPSLVTRNTSTGGHASHLQVNYYLRKSIVMEFIGNSYKFHGGVTGNQIAAYTGDRNYVTLRFSLGDIVVSDEGWHIYQLNGNNAIIIAKLNSDLEIVEYVHQLGDNTVDTFTDFGNISSLLQFLNYRKPKVNSKK
ncbi:hypothetical protein KFE98_12585 [bacterium SCSIO 12741]|nr:hypothetical protein KFE98_12585 [bacterium SCSIO 12741]